jgi:hypothetical protein
MRRKPHRAVRRASPWARPALLLALMSSTACSAVLGIGDVPSVEDGAAPAGDAQLPDVQHPDVAPQPDAEVIDASLDVTSPDSSQIVDAGDAGDSAPIDSGPTDSGPIDSGHDAAPTGIVLKGGIRPLGVPPAAGSVRLTHQGLTIPIGITCNASMCIKSGGIAP